MYMNCVIPHQDNNIYIPLCGYNNILYIILYSHPENCSFQNILKQQAPKSYKKQVHQIRTRRHRIKWFPWQILFLLFFQHFIKYLMSSQPLELFCFIHRIVSMKTNRFSTQLFYYYCSLVPFFTFIFIYIFSNFNFNL